LPTLSAAPDRIRAGLRCPYFRPATPLRWDEDVTHTDNPLGPITSGEHYEWPHSVSEVLTALLDAGLRLTSFEEHTGILWEALPHMTREAACGASRPSSGTCSRSCTH
jgi:hypothetical protein